MQQTIENPKSKIQNPIGIFPLPAGYLLLPQTEAGAEALTDLLNGNIPAEFPTTWRFYQAALAGDTEAALAALTDDDTPEARYNRVALTGDPAAYETLRGELTGDLALLLDMVAYTLGWIDTPPEPADTTDEVRAMLLSAQAAAALEVGDYATAQETLAAAVESARPVSPLLAAQLLADLAETRAAANMPAALVAQPYREALDLLAGTGLAELRAQYALRLGMLYQEAAQGRRGALLEAARCYQEALRFFTREAHPEPYALAQNNLALAYLAMPMTEASDQLRMAIAVQSLREACAVYTREEYPDRWASAQLNLANALQYLPSGRPEEHLAEAVQIYEDLLQARDQVTDLPGYARLLANQGNALAHLGIFAHARPKLQEAERRFSALGDRDSAAAVRDILADIDQRENT
jgi:tetratricopeptide (TPR) repeat protein